MDKSLDAPRAKEPYQKPELRKIRLEAGELAAAGCKTTMIAMGPTFGACSTTMCMAVGS